MGKHPTIIIHQLCALLLLLLATLCTSQTSGRWGPWSEWSSCSKSCDTGLTTRSRQCYAPYARSNTPCFGVAKQVKVCNSQACQQRSQNTIREKCRVFNNKLIGGRRYTWEPYHKVRGGVSISPCDVTCRARGLSSVYARLHDNSLTDGIQCTATTGQHGRCVQGTCKVAGCDGVLGSGKQLDKCGVCSGNNTTCHIISGIFTRVSLPYGYNQVTSIPAGACNINVTEMHNTNNYMAIKYSRGGRYILNGNWALGYTNTYEGAGTSFQYHRPTQHQQESIIAAGPTNTSIDIMMIKQSDNRGILYSYTIPTSSSSSSSSHRRRHHRRHHRRQNYKQIEDNKQETDSARIKHKTQPLKLDDNVNSKTAALSALDKPQGDEEQESYEDRYRDYLEKLRRQQEDQRQLRMQQRRQRQEDARKEREQEDNRRAEELRRQQQEQKEELERQEKLREYARNTGFQAKGNENVYRNINKASSLSVSGTGSTGQQIPLPQTQFQTTNRQIIPATNFGYPIPSGTNLGPQSAVSSPNRYPLLPNSYPNALSSAAASGPRALTAAEPPSSYAIPPAVRTYSPPSGASNQQSLPPQVISAYKPGYHAQYPAQSGRPAASSQLYPGQGFSQQAAAAGFRIPAGNIYSGSAYSLSGKTLNDQVVAGHTGQLDTYDSPNGDYGWKISGFTPCSATCGGGTQNTVVVCVRLSTQTVVTDTNCMNAIKPKLQAVTCNNLACPPDWEEGAWGSCSTTCDPGRQSREVKCKQRLSSALSLDVAGNECDEANKPTTLQRCNDDKPCVGWKIGDWGQCSTECGLGQRTREVVCMTAEGRVTAENKCRTSRPTATEICDMGSCAKTWFFTEWSEECSTDCGDGFYSRKIHCSASSDRCSAISKVTQTSPCKNDIPCGGQWFTGPWKKCDVPCGEGHTERSVVCMKQLGGLMAVVSEENCLLGEKPLTEQVCQRDPCLPQWYMTEWAECSRSCGGGMSTREVKCLDALQNPSTLCSHDQKPVDRQTCNTYPCPEKQSHDTQQHQGCADKFENCRVIVQARLCRFDYYKEVCCFSCSKRHHHKRSKQT